MNQMDGQQDPATDRVEVRDLDPAEWNELKSSTLKLTGTIYMCDICKLLPNRMKNAIYRSMGVDIGDNVTLGHSSSTRPGITIGDGATIGAHSFVDRDVEPGEKVAGVPIEPV